MKISGNCEMWKRRGLHIFSDYYKKRIKKPGFPGFGINVKLRLRHKTNRFVHRFSVREACALAFSAPSFITCCRRLRHCGNGDSVPAIQSAYRNGISHFAFQMTIHLAFELFFSSGMLWPVTAERISSRLETPLCSAHRSELPAARRSR